jgi:tetratricopeptide (TPR) repeat protein
MRLSLIQVPLSLCFFLLVCTASSAPVGKVAKSHATSKSVQYPSYVAPTSDAPASCFAAARELDSNRDGKLDAEIIKRKKVPATAAAETCTKDGDAPWGHYLKARTLAAQLKFDGAAAAVEQAQRSALSSKFMPPPNDDLALFRANALSDAGRFEEAIPFYDYLIRKKPNNALLRQLRDNRTWPPGPGSAAGI